MLEKYFSYLYYLMGYSYNLIRKSKKKGLQVYRYEGYVVCFLNDYPNRRLLVFFYKKSTKQLYRVALHGYYVREIRRKITHFVKCLQEDENFFNEKIMSRRSYSYKRERAYKSYLSYQRKIGK